VGKFAPMIARNLRQRWCKPRSRWYFDEMVSRIAGKQMSLWRAVDDEGEVLEVLIQRRRNKAAAGKLIRKLLRKQGFAPGQSGEAYKFLSQNRCRTVGYVCPSICTFAEE
jgi:putative transposase